MTLTRIDVSDAAAMKEAAKKLHEATQFGVLDCRKALHMENGNLSAAAEYLASGAWMRGKSVSWDWDSLRAKATQLSQSTGIHEAQCLDILKNCGGNAELAKRKLSGLPAWP